MQVVYEALDKIRAVTDALAARADALTRNFVSSGSFEQRRPLRICFHDGESVAIGRRPLDARTLAPLLARLAPAPVGKGRETVVDPAVRRALSAKAAGSFTVEGLELGEVLAKIARELTPDAPVAPTAELLDVHVYGPGGHFEPHKDTPRGADMLGTLVICLPSRFRGGVLRIGEGDEQEEFDWAEALRNDGTEPRIYWAAFFADVDHAIAPVTSGQRVTLTYVLRRAAAEVVPVATTDGTAALAEELARAAQALPAPLTLAFPCRHLYADSALPSGTAALRGRDREVARAALAVGLTTRVRPYLALGTPDDASFVPLERAPARDELQALPEQVAPNDLESWQCDHHATVVPVARWYRKHVATREYSDTGYFGNEGAELDFYRCAAVEVDIPVRDEARGRRVRHAKFGPGSVLRSERRNGEVVIVVAFDDGSQRALLERFLVDA